MKRVLLFLIAVLASLLFGCTALDLINPYSPKLEFTQKNCDNSVWDENVYVGLIETNWINDNTLEITGTTQANCGERFVGSFEIVNDTIYAIYNYAPNLSGTYTTCDCPKNLVFKITNLQNKKYDVQFCFKEKTDCTNTKKSEPREI